MTKIPHIYLDDMLEAIDLVEKYCLGISEEAFSRDTKLQDAVIRRFSIIGEAANRLPDDARLLAPHIPWKTIIGFRNVVIHEYAGVHMGRVWEIVQQELPVLKKQLADLLAKLPSPPNPQDAVSE